MEPQPLQPAVQQTPQDIPPLNPPPSKPSLLLPILLTILITILVLIGGYFGYQYLQQQPSNPSATPTPTETAMEEDPTANWQTYINTRYGYRFQYPADLTLSETEGYENSELVTGEKTQQITLENDSISINIYFEGRFDHGFDPWELSSQTPITIDNKPGMKTALTSPESDGLWTIYSIENFHSFRIEASTDQNDQTIVDQILSTFELGDSAPQKNTSDDLEGFIRQVILVDDRYQMTVDPAEWVEDETEPNGYYISNPLKETVILSINSKTSIIMQTYSINPEQNNFNFNQRISSTEFAEYIQHLTRQDLFFTIKLDPSTNEVLKITEIYRP